MNYESHLREALEKVWGQLGEYAIKKEAYPDPEKLCDEISQVLNDTDPNLEGLSGRMRATYSEYQPIEILRFINEKRNSGKTGGSD